MAVPKGSRAAVSCIALSGRCQRWPGRKMRASAGSRDGRSHLLASHADRERVIGVLKSAFVQGMLAKDEFELRVGQTLASRTYAELAVLTADLPAGLAAARNRPKPARAQGRQPVVRPGRVIEVATALYAGEWAYVLSLSPHRAHTSWAPPVADARAVSSTWAFRSFAWRRSSSTGQGQAHFRWAATEGGLA